jgi:hypothetical protein
VRADSVVYHSINASPARPCPVCGHQRHHRSRFSQNRSTTGEGPIAECDECGFAFLLRPPPDFYVEGMSPTDYSVLARRTDDFGHRTLEVAAGMLRRDVLDVLPPKGVGLKLLDIGCGTGG